MDPSLTGLLRIENGFLIVAGSSIESDQWGARGQANLGSWGMTCPCQENLPDYIGSVIIFVGP